MKPYWRLPHIYDVATTNDNWVNALDHLSDAIHSKGIMLFASNKVGFDYEIHAKNSFYDQAEDLITEYMGKFGHYDQEALQITAKRPHFERCEDTEIWPDLPVDFDREDINFLKKHVGLLRRVGYNISTTSTYNAVLAAQFENSIDISNQTGIDNADILMPHISKALEINRFYSQLQSKYNAVLGALDRVNVGICISNERSEIIISNKNAQKIFDAKDSVYLDQSKKITVRNEDVREEIKDCIKKCAQTAAGENDLTEYDVIVNRQSGAESLLLSICPLRDGGSEFETNFAGAMILIIDPQNPPKYNSSMLGKLMELTPAEIKITDLLLQGISIIQIAEMREVAYDTVKNQCKSIYAKSSVRSRADLVRTFISLSPPID